MLYRENNKTDNRKDLIKWGDIPFRYTFLTSWSREKILVIVWTVRLIYGIPLGKENCFYFNPNALMGWFNFGEIIPMPYYSGLELR